MEKNEKLYQRFLEAIKSLPSVKVKQGINSVTVYQGDLKTLQFFTESAQTGIQSYEPAIKLIIEPELKTLGFPSPSDVKDVFNTKAAEIGNAIANALGIDQLEFANSLHKQGQILKAYEQLDL